MNMALRKRRVLFKVELENIIPKHRDNSQGAFQMCLFG